MFSTPLPQPFQPPALEGSRIGADEVHRFTTTGGDGGAKGRPARNTDTARCSASLNAVACRIMRPSVSALKIASGVIWRRVSRVGASLWPSR